MPVVDLLELPALLPASAPIVGLDLGEKTIGVAVSDATRTVASPLELIRKTASPREWLPARRRATPLRPLVRRPCG